MENFVKVYGDRGIQITIVLVIMVTRTSTRPPPIPRVGQWLLTSIYIDSLSEGFFLLISSRTPPCL